MSRKNGFLHCSRETPMMYPKNSRQERWKAGQTTGNACSKWWGFWTWINGSNTSGSIFRFSLSLRGRRCRWPT
jgi:hypothetical protein